MAVESGPVSVSSAKIHLGRGVYELSGERGRDTVIARRRAHQAHQLAGVAGARRPPSHAIPALAQMLEAGLAVFYPGALAGAVEDLAELLLGWIRDVDLAGQATQHNLSQHLVWLVRGGKD